MDDWPELDELKQVLDVVSDDWDGLPGSGDTETRLTRLLSAAIAKVKADVGDWDEDIDVPDASLAQAALRMAELMALKPELASNLTGSSRQFVDPTYQALLFGHRRKFGVA